MNSESADVVFIRCSRTVAWRVSKLAEIGFSTEEQSNRRPGAGFPLEGHGARRRLGTCSPWPVASRSVGQLLIGSALANELRTE